MKEKTCAFFGHRDMDYAASEEKIKDIVENLVATGVWNFLNGNRGNFDRLCARVVGEIKQADPRVRLTLALSYMPKEGDELPRDFNDSVYLLERRVPPRYAIAETNKIIVQKADIIVSGVVFTFGGAYRAICYAKRLGKTIIQI